MESQHRGGDSEEGRLETEKLLDRLADLLRGNPERIRRFQEYLEEVGELIDRWQSLGLFEQLKDN